MAKTRDVLGTRPIIKLTQHDAGVFTLLQEFS
jgi:hypothetical protein